MLWQILANIGFTEKEAKVYVTLLELGSQPVSTIAKHAEINRTTCYLILDDLKKKGLVSSFDKASIKYFSASAPEGIKTYLNSKRKDIDIQETFLNSNFDILKNIIEQRTVKPKVQFFEGLEGIKAVYMDTLKSTDGLLSFWAIDEIPHELNEFIFKEYIPERVKKKIKIKVIAPDHPSSRKVFEKNKEQLREMAFFPKTLPLKIEINIYANKVAFMAYANEEYAGIIIDNPRISESMKTIHQLAWQFCSKKS